MEWSARQLQNTVRGHFGGRQLIVVSNREPVVHELGGDGTVIERQPVSGLVSALDPVLRSTGGTWIAHGSGDADRAMVDPFDRLKVRSAGTGYTLRRIWLTRGEERGYYQGFSNGALWPLCHLAFESPRFTRTDWRHYQDVNRRFAEVDGVADAMANALTLPFDDQARRMRRMRAHLAEHNVFWWAGRLLFDAAGSRVPRSAPVAAPGGSKNTVSTGWWETQPR